LANAGHIGSGDPQAQAGASAGQKVAGAIAWTVIPRAAQILVSFGTSILIVRTLREYDYGTLSVLRTILILTTVVLGLGLGQALNRYIPELRVTDRRDEGRRLLYRCLLLQVSAWFLTSVALLLLRGLLQRHYPTYGSLLVLGVFLSLSEVAAGTVNQYAISSYRTREMALASGLGSVVLGIGTTVLLQVGLRIPGVLIASAAGFAANALVLAGLLWRARPLARPAPAPPEPDLETGTAGGFPWRRLLAYALPWVPQYVLTFVIWRQSETLLLGIYRTRQEAGFFDLAYKLPLLILEFVPGAIYPLILAGFAETATVARERMTAVIDMYYRFLFFVTAPLSLLGFALGDLLLARMYGEAMAQGGPFCQAFFLVFAVSFFGTPLSMTVYVIEKVWVNVLLSVGYGVLTIGLDLLLIPRYGLLGATIPTAFVTCLTPFVRYAIARRYLPGIRIPWRQIARIYLASSPLLLLFWVKEWAVDLPRTALLLVASAGVTLVSYRLGRVLGPLEREFLRKSRVPGKEKLLRLL
jgi:O-antigen/teichoic acid export membrane protein